ncbi:hypothetical protein ScPMuIL_004990 [Solemya velum]
MDTDKYHALINGTYKSLNQNFKPAVQELVQTAKVYRKALLGTAAAAKAYTDSLALVGLAVQGTGKTGSKDIAEAIQKIAEMQNQMHVECIGESNAILNELLMPLGSTLPGLFQNAGTRYKRYFHGNKVLTQPALRAEDSLRRYQRKNRRSQNGFKATKYAEMANHQRQQLNDYRLQAITWAMLDERQMYSLVLDSLCNVESMKMQHHSVAVDMLKKELPKWKEIAAHPKELPEDAKKILQSVEAVSIAYAEAIEKLAESDYSFHGTPDMELYESAETLSLGPSIPHRTKSVTTGGNPKSILRSNSLPPQGAMKENSLPPRGAMNEVIKQIGTPEAETNSQLSKDSLDGPQVQATYTFLGNESNKLGFLEGDTLVLIGDTSDGWQYGCNSRTEEFGWFPISFTSTLEEDIPPPPAVPEKLYNKVDVTMKVNGENRPDKQLTQKIGRPRVSPPPRPPSSRPPRSNNSSVAYVSQIHHDPLSVERL